MLALLAALAGCGVTTARRAGGGVGSPIPFLATPAATATCNRSTQWRPPAQNVSFDDFAMVAPEEGWAVGAITTGSFGSGNMQSSGVIYHLLNGQWTRLSQTFPGAGLVALSMDSPDDGWAVSTSPVNGAGNRVLALHYTAGQWQQVDVPALDAAITNAPGTSGSVIMTISVQMFGPDAGWMFAWTNVARDPNNPASRAKVVILRYEHGTWTPIAMPPVDISTELFSLSAVSATEAWIVGTDYGGDLKTLFAHYVNGSWSLWPQTFPGVTEQFTMLSPTDGWAFDSGVRPALLLHYNGASWSSVAMPASWASQNIELSSAIFSISPSVLWFVAFDSNTQSTKMVQYTSGQWHQVVWPYADVGPVNIVAGSAGELWGVGNIAHQEGCAPGLVTDIWQGVLLHFQQGSWSKTVLP